MAYHNGCFVGFVSPRRTEAKRTRVLHGTTASSQQALNYSRCCRDACCLQRRHVADLRNVSEACHFSGVLEALSFKRCFDEGSRLELFVASKRERAESRFHIS